MDLHQFCQLLDAFQSPENAIRSQAESAFESLKQQDPNGTITLLLTVLRTHTDPNKRRDACIYLRTTLREFWMGKETNNIWNRLSPHTQEAVKTALVDSIEAENSTLVMDQICDTVGKMAGQLTGDEEKGWLPLTEELFSLVQSEDADKRTAGLKVLKECVDHLPKTLVQHQDALAQVISQSIMNTHSFSVRFESIGLIRAVVDSLDRPVWKKLQGSLPHIMASLGMMLQDQKKHLDHAKEVIEDMITMAESEALFFKPHLPGIVTQMLTYIRTSTYEDDIRQLAVEFLLTLAQQRPKAMGKVPHFVDHFVPACMELMLEVEDDPEWQQNDDDDDEDTTNYDVGEEALDRIANNMGAEDVLPHVFRNASVFLEQGSKHNSWKHKLVAIMSISQVAEYIDEDELDSYLPKIIHVLLTNVEDVHPRVRFAALHAIGQVSLDHNPHVQDNHAEQILPAIVKALNDPEPKVCGHAAAAFVNFGEDVDEATLLPHVDPLMNRLYALLAASGQHQIRSIKDHSVTAIAVVAGVVEQHFIKFYTHIIPLLKTILAQCTSKDDRRLRGKAYECISLIGLAVGRDTFRNDAKEVMQSMITVYGSGLDADDPQKEYIQEAFPRMCRVLKEEFIPYLSVLMPHYLSTLRTQATEVDTDATPEDEIDDMSLAMVDQKCMGLKTTVVEDIQQAVTIIKTFLEVLGTDFREYIPTTTEAVVALLSFHFADDVKTKAVGAMAELIRVTRELVEQREASQQGQPAAERELLVNMVVQAIDRIFKCMEEEEDLDNLRAQAMGITRCIAAAKGGVLNDDQLSRICECTITQLTEATHRRIEREKDKPTPQEPGDTEEVEDDMELIEEEQEAEQSLRSSLAEVLAVIMKHYPDAFLRTSASKVIPYVGHFLQPNSSVADRALGLYFICDFLEHLQDRHFHEWGQQFVAKMLDCVLDDHTEIKQPACYGVSLASRLSAFVPAVQVALERLHHVIVQQDKNTTQKKRKEMQPAIDNAVSAYGEILVNCGSQSPALSGGASVCGMTLQQHYGFWLDHLPLRADPEEGQKVHEKLLKLMNQNHEGVLGPNRCHLPRLVGILSRVYKTDCSTDECNTAILSLLQQIGHEQLHQWQQSGAFKPKEAERIEKVWKDIAVQSAKQQHQAATAAGHTPSPTAQQTLHPAAPHVPSPHPSPEASPLHPQQQTFGGTHAAG